MKLQLQRDRNTSVKLHLLKRASGNRQQLTGLATTATSERCNCPWMSVFIIRELHSLEILKLLIKLLSVGLSPYKEM